MDYEEAKEKIVAGLTKKQKVKSKFYFNDLAVFKDSLLQLVIVGDQFDDHDVPEHVGQHDLEDFERIKRHI